jgi:hypothetical protein
MSFQSFIHTGIKSLFSAFFLLLVLVTVTSYQAVASTLMVLSDDLIVCASDNQKYCTEKGKNAFSTNARQSIIFDITDEALVRAMEYAWTEQLELQQQMLELLKKVKPKFENKPLNERQFVRALRTVNINVQGAQLNGRDIWQSLYEFEKRNLFDLLEQKQIKGRNTRLKTVVNLADNTNAEAMLAYKKLYDLSREISGSKRKPRIAVVTGTNRDPYARVDYYLDLFGKLGFDATWLPVDAAMQTAITAKQYKDSACDSLEDFQIKRLASFRRRVIYPDLFQQQTKECNKSDPLIDTIKKMDAVYIAGDSKLLSYHAFYTPTGTKSALLNKISEMFAGNELLVAVQGGSVNALTSTQQPLSILTGKVNDLNPVEPITFVAGNEACSLGADCIALESERELTVVNSDILPFLPNVIIDTKMSKRGHQLRSIQAALYNGNNHLLGLDEKTAVVILQGGKATDLDVIGSGGLWVIDVKKEQNLQGIRNFSSHYFTHGDRIKMNSENISVEFPSWKYATQLQTKQPRVISAHVFARNNFYKLNEMMCKTGATRATGNDTLGGQQVNVVMTQDPSMLARSGVVKIPGAEFQVCTLSKVANTLKVTNKL